MESLSKITARLTLALCVVTGLLWCTVAQAAECDGEAVLGQLDARLNTAQDLDLNIKILNQIPGKSDRTMGMSVRTRGHKRFTEFHAPGDVKGTKVLSLSRSKMYVYLPAYQKVRRITSHTTDQGFMGTTLSQDDMATTHYGQVYTATSCSVEGESYLVKAKPREGAEVAYGSAVFKISADKSLPQEIRYFSVSGKHVKTENRTEYECRGEYCNPNRITMTDHTRAGAKTTLTVSEWKKDTSFPESVFSKRNLQRDR
jgi:outer membrane lipoprotein-sorting protein